LERELVYNGDEGTTEESGATRRLGIDVGARLQLLDWLWLDADAAYAHGRYKDLPEGSDFIPLAPQFCATGGLTIRHPDGFEANIRLREMSARPANEENTVHARPYLIVDGGLAYRFTDYRLSLIAENLFNTPWNEAQFDTESQLRGEAHPVSELHFTPGTPLSLRAKVEVDF
jgi:outer membrane receptor protein involved in Fe transport